ncbi:MAG TPA: hypothetical protein VHF25_06425 [Nitriliruptorales bacterium]|nr:hypothetical protein [Nitriliruptorales bacterium]
MPTDLRPAPTPSGHESRLRHRSWLLLAAAAWNGYVWLTRLGLVLDGRNTVPFRVVHGVLIVVSLGFAVALAVVGWRMRREARTERVG